METIDLSALPDLPITGVRMEGRDTDPTFCLMVHVASRSKGGFRLGVMVGGHVAANLEDRLYKTQTGAVRVGLREAKKLGWEPASRDATEA